MCALRGQQNSDFSTLRFEKTLFFDPVCALRVQKDLGFFARIKNWFSNMRKANDKSMDVPTRARKTHDKDETEDSLSDSSSHRDVKKILINKFA